MRQMRATNLNLICMTFVALKMVDFCSIERKTIKLYFIRNFESEREKERKEKFQLFFSIYIIHIDDFYFTKINIIELRVYIFKCI